MTDTTPKLRAAERTEGRLLQGQGGVGCRGRGPLLRLVNVGWFHRSHPLAAWVCLFTGSSQSQMLLLSSLGAQVPSQSPDSWALDPAMGTSSAVLCILFFCGALGKGRLGVLWGSGRGSWKSLRAGEGV